MNTMEYKDYVGSAEVDIDAGVVVGRLLFIRDTITYSSVDVGSVRKAFEEAVDDYLTTCQELGDQPDVPCKGSFNVRVGPERHRMIATEARKLGIGLNDYVCQALDAARAAKHEHTTHNHNHIGTVTVQMTGSEEPVVARTSGQPSRTISRANTAH